MVKLKVDKEFKRAKALENSGDFDQARAVYLEILNAFPQNLRAKKALARIASLASPNKVDEDIVQRKIGRLVQLLEEGRVGEVVSQAELLVTQFPQVSALWNLLGVSHTQMGRWDDAVAAFKQVIALGSSTASAYNNLGNANLQCGNIDGAFNAFSAAITTDPGSAEAHFNMGNLLKVKGELEEAIVEFERAHAINDGYHAAFYNKANTLKRIGKLEDARAAYKEVIRIKSDHAEAQFGLAEVYDKLGMLTKAVKALDRGLAIDPNNADANFNKGLLARKNGQHRQAIEALENTLKINGSHEQAKAWLLHQRYALCDWGDYDGLQSEINRLGLKGKAVPPFIMLSAEDAPERQFHRSVNYAEDNYKGSFSSKTHWPKTRSRKLKVGYFSPDFHNHPMLYLTAGLFRLYDREKFEVVIFSYGHEKAGDLRQETKANVDQFFDVSDLSDLELIALAHSQELDIAVDLAGYTNNSRSQVFQARLAPIQVNFLGYPGTSGADFMDYIIADKIVIPEDQRVCYSEKVIYLPSSYYPTDYARWDISTNLKKSDFDLPEDAFVFCCFNNSHKIGAREFDIWMRVLKRVEGSVLWLLSANEHAKLNLCNTAAASGIEPSRLIFAERVPFKEHLARHIHADLFIDTFNYNAHTTASDALWMELPVITKQGQQFSARVASSLLQALEMNELITKTEEAYEAKILEVAQNPDKIMALNEKLRNNIRSSALFDGHQYVATFEAGLAEAHKRFLDGCEAEDIKLN